MFSGCLGIGSLGQFVLGVIGNPSGAPVPSGRSFTPGEQNRSFSPSDNRNFTAPANNRGLTATDNRNFVAPPNNRTFS